MAISYYLYVILSKLNKKKMFNQDEEKIKCALENREICFWQGKKAEIVVFFIYDIRICGIYLSMALGTEKFKQLD